MWVSICPRSAIPTNTSKLSWYTAASPWSSTAGCRDAPLHDAHHRPIHAARRVIGGVVVYIFSPSQLACPFPVGELPRCVCVEEAAAVESDLHESGFEGRIDCTDFVSQRPKHPFQSPQTKVVPRPVRRQPVLAGLPPMFNVFGCPRDAVVHRRGLARDPVVIRR